MNEHAGTLSDRLRRCAQLAGSGNALSEKSGVARTTLENYLNGRSEPKAGAILNLAKAAGVNVEWLLAGTGPMRPGEDRGPMADGYAVIKRLSVRALEERLDALEARLSELDAFESDERQAVQQELDAIAERPDIPDRVRARADLYLDLAFNDIPAQQRRRAREVAHRLRSQDARSRLDAILEAQGWKPTISAYQALLTLAIAHDVGDEMLSWVATEMRPGKV